MPDVVIVKYYRLTELLGSLIELPASNQPKYVHVSEDSSLPGVSVQAVVKDNLLFWWTIKLGPGPTALFGAAQEAREFVAQRGFEIWPGVVDTGAARPMPGVWK